ncbi:MULTISPECIES: hypothetical protein [Bacillus]|uniref:hypothetical protein n=1 Tax=Bacillus TaxID=1386 RepID=UPI0013B84A02|nr:hypothetical protein [Bacillus subtilis]KAF2427322.1 hypothetical protein B6K89_03820 [Bacillus subtilis]MCY9145680.1 hypothetical protein [Bacillus sp. T9C1]
MITLRGQIEEIIKKKPNKFISVEDLSYFLGRDPEEIIRLVRKSDDFDLEGNIVFIPKLPFIWRVFPYLFAAFLFFVISILPSLWD